MIIVLNGYPGVGKLTIGRKLASVLHGKLLDIHTIYNVAFALTEFRSPEFREAVKKVEAIAHDLIYRLPQDQPVVLTTVLAGDSELANAEWNRMEQLGEARPPFCVVHITCDLKENTRRIQSEERDKKMKPRDPGMALRNQTEAKVLAGSNELNLLRLDTTNMTPDDAANVISDWVLQL